MTQIDEFFAIAAQNGRHTLKGHLALQQITDPAMQTNLRVQATRALTPADEENGRPADKFGKYSHLRGTVFAARAGGRGRPSLWEAGLEPMYDPAEHQLAIVSQALTPIRELTMQDGRPVEVQGALTAISSINIVGSKGRSVASGMQSVIHEYDKAALQRDAAMRELSRGERHENDLRARAEVAERMVDTLAEQVKSLTAQVERLTALLGQRRST